MKGIAKRVVEIVEPQHEYIERVLVVLRADCPEVRVEARKAQAEKYVSELVCWRQKLWPADGGARRALLLGLAFVGAAGFLTLLWLL